MNKDPNKILDPADMLVAKRPMVGHPGKFIRDTLIPEYGLNVASTARAIGMDRASFINALDGKSAVTRPLAYKLGALMRDEVTDLLIAWQLKHDLELEAEERARYRQIIKRVEPVAA